MATKKITPHRIKDDDLMSLLLKGDRYVLRKLNETEFGFIIYLEKRRYADVENTAHALETVIEIINRVCSLRALSLRAQLDRFLRMLSNCKDFLFDDVPRLIHSCVSNETSVDLITFLVNYLNILKTVVRKDYFPSKRVSNGIFPTLENYMNRLREQRIANLDKAELSFQALKREVERLDEPADSNDEDDDDINEDFRSLSIVPRSNDIVNYEISNIPQNIVEGPYKSVNHYLSVHYRLTREDMLRSFRECVKMCILPNSQIISKSRVYDKVFIKYPPEYTAGGIVYGIKITTTKDIDWSKKEALIPGSLVFLTPDSFESVVFASVKSNPRVNKAKSKEIDIKIKLEDDLLQDELYKDRQYKMIEPSAYFECYKHVLSAIKDFSKVTFPLSDIIADLDNSDPEPRYMDELKEYCLHEKCDSNEYAESCPCKVFNPLKEEEWPSSEDLKLDVMQYNAFKVALTKKVAVIQGPPGTGKTFIGVKVVKSLITNVSYKPIVICCLTNHALDQFLERILSFTQKVVRLGSQSKSEILEPYKLENLSYAKRQYIEGETLDETLTKSLKLIKKIARKILELKIQIERDPEYYEIKAIGDSINGYLHIYSLCQDRYLDDSALNDIIDSTYKSQLRRVAGAVSKSLSAGVLEWLVCSRSNDLYEKCRKKFQQFESTRDLDIPLGVQDIWALTETKRYALFYFWRRKCLNTCKENLELEIKLYKAHLLRYKDKSYDADKLELLKGADVIGVTTTGACKYRDYLRLTEPRIMIVEEAAQVLESHIIASLVPSIQHLILIGDHEQLRPLPADNELSEKYNLKVSMFERLFNNGAPSATLELQHRMKPCIAELLVPKPYAVYRSFENVYKYEEINGVQSSVFFFDHSHFEDEHSSGTSSSNDFEAQMVVSLAKYLSFVQYTTDKMTILATYAAQVDLILRHLKVQKLAGIHVTTVDNFQGEENDIILLSFVRSNDHYIGFLKESNRVCVALSRARKGMFCFGNFKLFASKNELWRDIVEKLRDKNMIGETLSLKCARHQSIHPVESSEDILDFISSGCSENCNIELPCTHRCARRCHFLDADHFYYLCKEPCKRMIDETRVCPRLCYEKCKKSKKAYVELPCGHSSSRDDALCLVEVPVRLPCTHEVTIPCYVDAQKYQCNAIVKIKLDCGHLNGIRCFERKLKRNIICNEMRQEIGPCGHSIAVPCSMHFSENDVISFCDKACGVLLACGHPCVGLCRICFDTGIHAFCSEKCELILTCGHICGGHCGSPCPPCKQKCLLSCGHSAACNDCLRPCIECEEPCERVCRHKKCRKMCWEDCSIDPCMEPCVEELQCGHQCIGLCGDPCPYLCRECQADSLKYRDDRNYLYVQLECDHVVEVDEMNARIRDNLSSFEWPCCPECSKPITKSLRYKNELKHAKKTAIGSWDTSEEISYVWYLVDCMYGREYIVPAQFIPVNNEVHRILRNNPQSHVLIIMKTCVVLLRKLFVMSSTLSESNWDEYTQGKFYTLMKWIRSHLTNASFQQLRELEASVKQLQREVSGTTRIRLNELISS